MKILIDGDGCPVVDLAIEVGKKQGLQICLFCDTTHFFDRSDIDIITVSKGNDAVDFRIVNEVKAGDIIITQDYGLAAMGLARKAYPIHQNGMCYTPENIDRLLFNRHLGREIRRKGGRLKGPLKRTKEQNEAFRKALLQLIEQLKKKEEIQ